MKKHTIRKLITSIGLLASFVLWTVLVSLVDTQKIGPEGSAVGFATMNGWFRDLIGVKMRLYVITDWLGLVPLVFVLGFGMRGLIQWGKRKHILKVDSSILVLGGHYIVTLATYLLFENVVINYRPVLIDGFLEASYPSSTTMLVLCVMPTAVMQLNSRIKNLVLRRLVRTLIIPFSAFMVVGRLVSGVHWLTDIIGGGLLSAGLVILYCSIVEIAGGKNYV